MNPNATIDNINDTNVNPSTGAGRAGTGPNTPTATAQPATGPTPASPIRQLQIVLCPASAFGESILKSEYERLSKVISHLVSARFDAIDTLTLPTFNPASQEAPRPWQDTMRHW